MYKHAPDKPDDTFHAILYAWLASMLKVPRPDIITPRKENEQGNPVSEYIGGAGYQG